MNYPIKLGFKSEILPIILLAASIIFSFYFYTHIPNRVAIHWNIYGQPDGYGGKFQGAFLGSIILASIYVLFLILPLFDPKSERYQSFQMAYLIFRDSLMAIMLLIFLAAGLNNIGYNISINHTVPVLIGLLFIVLGNYMGKIKSNWFVGVRNPWTLSSENVWNKTNRVTGWILALWGVTMVFVPFFGKTYIFVVFIIGIFAMVFGSTIYSYILYAKEKKELKQ